VAGDEHIDSDTVFGVSDSLVISVNQKDPNSPIPNKPTIHYDFQLAAAAKSAAMSGRVGVDPSQILQKAH
jgi:catechol 1,2-dioxygenase/hydroxyquinol 1,2-dioxygenase